MERNRTPLASFLRSPRRVFAFDAFGAALSVLLNGVVVMALREWFGFPRPVLLVTAAVPLLFIAYDLLSFRFGRGREVGLLRGIAFLNLGYCLLVITLAVLHRDELTGLGWAYAAGEVLVVATIAQLELVVAKGLTMNR